MAWKMTPIAESLQEGDCIIAVHPAAGATPRNARRHAFAIAAPDKFLQTKTEASGADEYSA